ncbi:MAG: T9SS type A sorting domain-containing protein [Ferruginibacter sp.]|nr:T9SS type A sorting domain-containing protein [Ferruginibacter sp.]
MNNFTFIKTRAISFGLLFGISAFCILLQNKAHAQAYCNNETVYFFENFGTGTTPVSNVNVTSLLTYQATGEMETEGIYRVADNTFQKIEWHTAPDYTASDVNGRMLLVNAGAIGAFYRKIVNLPGGYLPGFYGTSLYFMNVNTPGTCEPNPVLPGLTIKVEYRDAGSNWIELINSPIASDIIPQTATPTWVKMGGVFTLPSTGAFVVTDIRISLSNSVFGSCGNDFAIDDIKLASCPDGAPIPVKFLHITAQKKGSGVMINWATATEINNAYFDVEKSTDGGNNWFAINRTKGSINSSVVKNYAAFDAKPAIGSNLYRIKQVDLDGASKYSTTVQFKLAIEKTDVSVLANPFTSNITVDLLSERNQVLHTRLFDNTGKIVNSQRINVSKGSSRKTIETAHLSRGIYILQVTDENGRALLSDKLIKQ